MQLSLQLVLLSLLALLLTFNRPACAQSGSDSASVPDAAVQPAFPSPSCANRYLLYSVQSGEGFSLRRDAFVRMAVSLMLSKHHAAGAGAVGSDGGSVAGGGGWTLVLPPLSSRLSPHWHQGLQHGGIHYTEQNVPWRELWDMDFLANQTGLRFVEFAQFAALQQDGGAPSATTKAEGAATTVDQVLHLCSFAYSSPFFEAGRLAGLKPGAPNFPGSSFPRSHVFHEFPCGSKPDADVGFCPNAMPQIVDVRPGRGGKASTRQAIAIAEYGSVRLSRSASDAVHCGHANLMPPVLPHLLDEYISPAVSTPSGKPLCSVLVTNSQLIFWPAPPYPGQKDTTDPAVATHVAKNLFMRSLRLSPMLLAIAHTFVRHELLASTAMPLSSAAALAAMQSDPASASSGADPSALPPYLSFHVRRGDFKRVHAGVVPELEHLAAQIVRRFRNVWHGQNNATAASSPSSSAPSAPLLSNRVFLSSDMSAAEFQELQGFMQQAQADTAATDAGGKIASPPVPAVELVRFDLERIRTDLRPHFSVTVNTYLDDAAARASLHASPARPAATATSHHSPSGVVPLTPFHVLLLDQFIAEQSLARVGFVGTRHSYVSEMVWQQRRAWQLEDLKRWEKDVLEGGPLPKPTANEKVATKSTSTSAPPTSAVPAARARKDEL